MGEKQLAPYRSPWAPGTGDPKTEAHVPQKQIDKLSSSGSQRVGSVVSEGWRPPWPFRPSSQVPRGTLSLGGASRGVSAPHKGDQGSREEYLSHLSPPTGFPYMAIRVTQARMMSVIEEPTV